MAGAALAAAKRRRELQLLERVHPPLASLGSGTLRLESHRTLFTLDNSTVKYREKTSAGESGPLRAEPIDFWLPSLRSLHPFPPSPPPPVLPYLPAQMDYQVELNEIKVDCTHCGVMLYRV